MTTPRHTRLLAVALAAALLAVRPAPAKIDLVTLPERGDVELTIYNSADLTLVQERRRISLGEGENPLQFSWANTLIDPTSVHLRVVEGEDFIDVVDISYPANTANTLIWSIEAARDGDGLVEISYFTSGITWSADYVATADPDEKHLLLDGYVRVTNNSGEDYLNARTRLLVGEVNLVEAFATLARMAGMGGDRSNLFYNYREQEGMEEDSKRTIIIQGTPQGGTYLGAAVDELRQKDVAKEGVSEYFLFTIEGREDLENGLSKRLPSFRAEDVPATVTYKLHEPRFGPQIVKLYALRNDTESELGASPLPDGFYQVFIERAVGGLAYAGRHDDTYIPIGEKVEMNLGHDGLVLFEDVRRVFRRENLAYSSYGDVTGWDEVEERELVLRNSRREAVPVELSRFLRGDFDFAAAPADANLWNKVSETEYELKATIEAMGERRFAFTIRTRTGSNARK